jgi:hypothetical protein
MAADVLATPEHVERVTGLPILGAIPAQRGRTSPSGSPAAAPVARKQDVPVTKESV